MWKRSGRWPSIRSCAVRARLNAFLRIVCRLRTAGSMPTDAQLAGARVTDDKGEGKRGAKVIVVNPELYAENSEILLNFNSSPQDGPGDGTVSKESGDAPRGKAGVQLIVPMTGFDHQGSYNNEHARTMLLYSICKLTQEAG